MLHRKLDRMVYVGPDAGLCTGSKTLHKDCKAHCELGWTQERMLNIGQDVRYDARRCRGNLNMKENVRVDAGCWTVHKTPHRTLNRT